MYGFCAAFHYAWALRFIAAFFERSTAALWFDIADAPVLSPSYQVDCNDHSPEAKAHMSQGRAPQKFYAITLNSKWADAEQINLLLAATHKSDTYAFGRGMGNCK